MVCGFSVWRALEIGWAKFFASPAFAIDGLNLLVTPAEGGAPLHGIRLQAPLWPASFHYVPSGRTPAFCLMGQSGCFGGLTLLNSLLYRLAFGCVFHALQIFERCNAVLEMCNLRYDV